MRHQRRRVERAGGEHAEHAVDVADHVGVAACRVSALIQTRPMWTWRRLGVHADGDDRARLAGEADRQVERVGMADGVDRWRRRPRPPVSRADDVARALLGQVDGGAPKLAGHLQPLPARCRPPAPAPAPAASATWTAHRPTGPEPQDRDAVAGPDPALLDGVVAGAHHVPGEQRHIVGDRVPAPAAASGSPSARAPARPGCPGGSRAARRGRTPASVALVVDAAQAVEARAAGACESSRAPGRRPGPG